MSWRKSEAVTPSDATHINFDALWIGGAGNVAIRDKSGSTVTVTGALAGSYVLIQGDRVLATGTTATAILALS